MYLYFPQTTLNEPITRFLQDASSQIKPSETKKIFQYSPTIEFNITFPNKSVSTTQQQTEEGFLAKTDSLCRKMRKHFESVKTNTNYGDLIEGLDEMSGDIVESIQNFQKENPLALVSLNIFPIDFR